jgi:hypothetical protein
VVEVRRGAADWSIEKAGQGKLVEYGCGLFLPLEDLTARQAAIDCAADWRKGVAGLLVLVTVDRPAKIRTEV